MSSAFFELYRSKVFELAKTMVVKFDPAARVTNRELEMSGLTVDPNDRRTWKYYKNLAGEYYTPTDTVMTVDSLDQLGTTIDFTVDNLSVSRLTRSEYRFGTDFYKRLVNRYPTQENLILGILHPVDKDEAIAAKDGDILYYDPALVESNETNLIPELQKWIKNFLARWHIEDYVEADELYVASVMGMMFVYLPQVIMNIRLANCKTERAHSYHIREYLESHGRLAKYLPYMNKKQALWLYRNIRYVHRNAGKQQTFDMLVENLLSERNLPLAEYEIRHNLANILQDLRPTVTMRRNEINFSHVGRGADVRDVDYVIGKEAVETPISQERQDKAEADLREKSKKVFKNQLPTKVLESAVVDSTDSVQFPLADVLLNHWFAYAGDESYYGSVRLTSPIDGSSFFLGVKDAIILYLYCFREGELDDSGDPLSDEIPVLKARTIRRDTPPTLEQLQSVVDGQLVSDETLEEALSVEYFKPLMPDSLSFYDACVDIQKGLMAHYDIYTRMEDSVGRAQVEKAVSLFYTNKEIELATAGTTFTQWLTDIGLDFTSMQPAGFRQLGKQILQEATGAGVSSSRQLQSLHKAMIDLMSELSSYSVQFVRTINSSAVIMAGDLSIRLARPYQAEGDDVWVFEGFSDKGEASVNIINALSMPHHYRAAVELDIQGDAVNSEFTAYMRAELGYDPTVTLDLKGSGSNSFNVQIPMVSVFEEDVDSTPLNTAVLVASVDDYINPDSLE